MALHDTVLRSSADCVRKTLMTGVSLSAIAFALATSTTSQSSGTPESIEVSGRLQSSSGRYSGKALMLRAYSIADGSMAHMSAPAFRQMQDGHYAPFWMKLPPGSHLITLEAFDGYEWDSCRAVIDSSTDDLRFTCMDDRPTFDLKVNAVSQESGEKVAAAFGLVLVGASANLHAVHSDWDTGYYHHLPRNSKVLVLAGAPNRKIARIELPPRPQEDTRKSIDMEARLSPGWGRIVKVESDQGMPLSGASVLLDEKPQSTSNELGLCVVNADACPHSVSVSLPGWEVSDGSAFLLTKDAEFGPVISLSLKRSRSR